jgi:hypothetical protein
LFQNPKLQTTETNIAPGNYSLQQFGPNKIIAYAEQLKDFAATILAEGPKLLTEAARDAARIAAGTREIPRISIYGHMIWLRDQANDSGTNRNPKPPICFNQNDLDALQVMLDMIMDILEQYNKL